MVKGFELFFDLFFGIGFYFGEVFYGNIGFKVWIDFIVLGFVVNIVVCLEGLCC